MFAQSLALCCLAAAVSSAWSAPANAELAVFLKTSPGQSNPTIESMKAELSDLMHGVGFSIHWQDAGAPVAPEGFPLLAVVQLKGVCAAPSGAFHATAAVEDGVSLAATAVSDGHLLPFSSVDCARVTNFVSPLLNGQAPARRDLLLGRAVARVIAHELYHALVETAVHSHEGVSKPAFTAQELLSATFAFDGPAVAKLERRAAESSAVDAAASAAEASPIRQ